MNYLEEAYRRFKLPIRVQYWIPGDEIVEIAGRQGITLTSGIWRVTAVEKSGLPRVRTTRFGKTPEQTKAAYLAAVKELSHEDQ